MTLPAAAAGIACFLLRNHPDSKPQIHFIQYCFDEPHHRIPPTYTMTCNQQGMAIKSTGRMTFNGDTFEGSARTVMGPQAGGMTMTTKLKGRRIGKCD